MGNGGNTIGWRKLIIVTTVSTAFAVFLDYIGIIDKIDKLIP
jgi:hypothetical protein